MANGRRKTSLGIGLVVAALAGVYWVATAPRRVADSQQKLAVDPADLDFGEVWEAKAFAWSLPIENRSDEEVYIERFETSCNCLGVEPRSLRIPARGRAEVRLILDLTRRPSDRGAEERLVHAFELPIVPRLRMESDRPTVWGLRGKVRTAVTLSPPALHFGEVIRGQPFTPQTVRVTPKTPIERLEVGCDRSLASVQVKRAAGKNDFELEVLLQEKVPVGPMRFDVNIRAVTRKGERLPAVGLAVAGQVLPEVQATPPSVIFGARPVGHTVEETIVLHSADGRKFGVDRIEVESPDVVVSRVGQRPDTPRQFHLSQRIARTGHQASTVRFVLQVGSGSGALTVAVPVSYHGIRLNEGPDAPRRGD